MKTNFRKLKKIQIIEEPRSEELLRSEIENVLAGWECACYDHPGENFSGSCIGFYPDGVCSNGAGENYCIQVFRI